MINIAFCILTCLAAEKITSRIADNKAKLTIVAIVDTWLEHNL